MRYLIPWRRPAPIDAPSRVTRAFDELLGSFPGFATELSTIVTADAPRVDVRETADALHVEAELPGIDEKDIEVSLHEGMLVLKGEKKVEQKQDHAGWHQIERAYGSFQRVIGLPAEVDGAKVEATFDKGVLRVRLPKSAPARPSVQKIAIQSGS